MGLFSTYFSGPIALFKRTHRSPDPRFRMSMFAEIAPERMGFFIGFGVLVCLSLAGTIKCWQIARRPTAHTLCAVALLLVFLGLMGSSIKTTLGDLQLVP